MLSRIREFLGEYGGEILKFFYAYSLSLLPVIGKIFAIGYSRILLRKREFTLELFAPIKEGVLRYLILMFFWVILFAFWFFFLSVGYQRVDPVLLRKYPEIFLYPAIKRMLILLFIRRLALTFLTIVVIVYPLKRIFSLNIADILMNPKMDLFIILLAGFFTYIDYIIGIIPIIYIPLNEYPFIFLFFRIFGDEVWKAIGKQP